jgi:flagellar protein FliO/FliZ
MLAALAIVIALMILAMVFIKKFFFHSLPEMTTGAVINIVSTRHLNPKSSIMLIEVLGQVLLVGISGQQMSMLSTINDPVAIEKIKSIHFKEGLMNVSDPLSRFKTLLQKIGGRRKDD